MVVKHFSKEEEGTIPGKCDMGQEAWVTILDRWLHTFSNLIA